MATINNYGRLLDEEFPTKRLLRVLEASEQVAVNDQPIGRKLNVSNFEIHSFNVGLH